MRFSLTAAFIVSVAARFSMSGSEIDYVVYGISVKSASSVVPFFFAGALLNEFEGRIPWRMDFVLFLAAVMFILSAFADRTILQVASYFAIPYIVLGTALIPLPTIADWGTRSHGDLSYGMYLYGAPIQQLIIHLYSGQAPTVVVLIGGLLGAATCALVSWKFVEAPALRLKRVQISQQFLALLRRPVHQARVPG